MCNIYHLNLLNLFYVREDWNKPENVLNKERNNNNNKNSNEIDAFFFIPGVFVHEMLYILVDLELKRHNNRIGSITSNVIHPNRFRHSQCD